MKYHNINTAIEINNELREPADRRLTQNYNKKTLKKKKK